MNFVDAFGQQLWDIYRDDDSFWIIERDDGRIEAGAGSFYFSDFPDWPSLEQEAIRLAKGRVLDIGCGAGRHALYLQNQGLDVLGIDQSPLAIQLCRERGLKQAEVCSITQAHRLGGRPFDTILMFGNNLGLLGNEKRGRWLLKTWHKVTGEGAMILAEILDPYQTDDPDHLAYHRRNRARGRMGGQVRIRVRHKMLKGPWFDYLFLSQDELAHLVAGTGWQIARCLEDGPHYVAVLEKAAGR
ncbi:MAG TPA: class I SAM-dependent methyltransferase [Chthonomonadaceae bacterium]|nr:class I SAM-dependent methyltransferase [Chthonomonadaceae bacterium]